MKICNIQYSAFFAFAPTSEENKAGLFKLLLISLFVLILPSFVLAQGTVKGFVKDKSSGEPIIGATVYLKENSLGASTDLDGYYSITKVPAGTYTLVVTSIGYDNQQVTIEVGNGVKTKNWLMSKSSIGIDKVKINAERQEDKTKVKISVESIQTKDIKKIPSVGGQADLVQALQVIPGVVTTGDQGGQLYIRGGSPVQNKVLLDGMIVYNPFHSIGLFSVFDVDIIKNADIYTGGFGAQYGGRISSIMDISTVDGNKVETKGRLGINPFGSKLTLEGPLKKLDESGGGISYVLSAKTSYLEQTSKLLYSYIDDEGLPFNFTDIYGKLSASSGSGSKVSAFGFRFSDDVLYQASDLDWLNWGFGANFVVVPSGSSMLINGQFAKSRYNITLVEEGLPDRFSQIDGFNFSLNFKYNIGPDAINYGIDVTGMNTSFQTFNTIGLQVEQEENTTELGFFGSYRMTREKLVLEPSFRLHYYASLAKASPEPRLGIKYNVTDRFRIKAAAGIYSQNLIAVNSDRDVVNLFYGFVAGPENLQDNFITDDGEVREVENPLQRANHLVAGFEYDLTEKININIEGYFKDFVQLTNANRNKIFADNFDNIDVSDYVKKDFIVESGEAKGVDFVMKYTDKKSNFWFVYSLGFVDRWDGFRWYDPVFDRRHNINLLLSHSIGEDNEWEFSARWNLGTGLPFTQISGVYQPIVIDGQISDDFLADNPNNVDFLYGGLNEGRLTAYHRLDISAKRTWKINENIGLEATAGVTNVYSRNNIFYYNRVTGEEVFQLPIMPSIGVEMTF